MSEILKAAANTYAFFHRKEFSMPLICEENLIEMNFKEKMWFGYKMFGCPMEHSQPEIERYFAEQVFDFGTPPGFCEQSRVVISSVGDLLCTKDATAESAEHFWDESGDFLFDADVCCGNLETPVVPDKPPTFVPKLMIRHIALNNSVEMFDVFHKSGERINLFSTANNHCLDLGEEGLLKTAQFLKDKGCDFVGTAMSEEERENFPIVEKNGVRIAFLSYTYALNKSVLPDGREYLANYVRLNKPGVDLEMVDRHIKIARLERNADVVVAMLHFSTEFDSYPLQNVIDNAHRVMELGVDVIIGNHAHVVQPLETYRYQDPFSDRIKQGYILYAHGDTVSPTEKTTMKNSRLSILSRLTISKGVLNGSSLTYVSDLKIRPIYLYTKYDNDLCTEFRQVNLVELMNDFEDNSCKIPLSEIEKEEVKRLYRLSRKVLPTQLFA